MWASPQARWSNLMRDELEKLIHRSYVRRSNLIHFLRDKCMADLYGTDQSALSPVSINNFIKILNNTNHCSKTTLIQRILK